MFLFLKIVKTGNKSMFSILLQKQNMFPQFHPLSPTPTLQLQQFLPPPCNSLFHHQLPSIWNVPPSPPPPSLVAPLPFSFHAPPYPLPSCPQLFVTVDFYQTTKHFNYRPKPLQCPSSTAPLPHCQVDE
ncbi:hypothetical protein CsSME_00002511 [Camellia sinensis var. sinensis]